MKKLRLSDGQWPIRGPSTPRSSHPRALPSNCAAIFACKVLFISTARVWALSLLSVPAHKGRPASFLLARRPEIGFCLQRKVDRTRSISSVWRLGGNAAARYIYERGESAPESISHTHATFSTLQIIPEQLSLVIEPSAGNLITERLAPSQVHPRRISRLFYTQRARSLSFILGRLAVGRHAAVLAAPPLLCVFSSVYALGAPAKMILVSQCQMLFLLTFMNILRGTYIIYSARSLSRPFPLCMHTHAHVYNMPAIGADAGSAMPKLEKYGQGEEYIVSFSTLGMP